MNKINLQACRARCKQPRRRRQIPEPLFADRREIHQVSADSQGNAPCPDEVPRVLWGNPSHRAEGDMGKGTLKRFYVIRPQKSRRKQLDDIRAPPVSLNGLRGGKGSGGSPPRPDWGR